MFGRTPVLWLVRPEGNINQESYSLLNDLKERKVDMTFAQTLELVPKLCREWRKVVSISKKGRRTTTTIGRVDTQDIRRICYNHEKDFLPILEVWCQGQVVAPTYVDGGAQVCVITEDTARRLQLKINRKHAYNMNMANNAVVRCVGVVQQVELYVLGQQALVDLHVMPARPRAYPLILGRP